MDFGLKQWAFCVTGLTAECPNGAGQAHELREYVISQGAKECLVLYSTSGWPKDAFRLQKDGIIWPMADAGERLS